MSDHTPGPWRFVSGNQIRSAVHQIARVWMMRNGEGAANGRLIAAAPELLEALQALHKAGGIWPDLLPKVEAAIRKATEPV